MSEITRAELIFDTGASVSHVNKYIRKINEAKNATDDFGQFVDRVSGRIKMTLLALPIAGLTKQMIDIRGQFQQTEIALSTMLGSTEKATALNKQLLETAAKTPFDYKGIVESAKNLLAYGFAAEQANETIVMLGDVASGLSQPLGDIVYLYGTLRASGRVTNIDIRQFANRGIPVYEELAKVMGVAESEINGLVSASKVGFPQIEQMFKNMTSEGGKFANLMEKQSKSISGQISNLGDSLDMMFNEIGKKSQGVISGGISVVSSLVENYEKVGKVLMGLVATYGAYRTALMFTTIATNGWTIASRVQYTSLLLVERAQKLLNATMLSNPYVAITTAVVALGATMWALADNTSNAEKANKRFAEAQEEAKNKAEEHKNKVESLLSVSRNDALATGERESALRELSSFYPHIFKQYDVETLKLADIAKIKREIAEIDNERAQKDDIDAQTANINKLNKLKADLEEARRATYTGPYGDIARQQIINQLQKEIDIQEKIVAKYKDKIARNKDGNNLTASNLAKLSEADIKSNIDAIARLLAKRSDMIKAGKDVAGWKGQLNGNSIIKGIYSESELAGIQAQLQSYLDKKKKTFKTYTELSNTAKNDVIKAEKELAEFKKLTSAQLKEFYNTTGEDPVAHLKKLQENVDDAKKRAKEYSEETSSKSVSKQVTDTRANAQKIREAQFEATQIEIDAMNESVQKKILQEKLNLDKRIEAIKRAREEAKKTAKENGIIFDETPYNEEIKNATNRFEVLSQKAVKEDKEAILKEFRDYQEKKLAIEKEYSEKIKKLEEYRKGEADKDLYDRAIAEAKKMRDEELSRLSMEQIQATKLWADAFGDLELASTSTLNRMIAKLKEWLRLNPKASIQDIKNAQEALNKAQDIVNDRKPFDAIRDGLTEYTNAIKSNDFDTAHAKLISISKIVDKQANEYAMLAREVGNLANAMGNSKFAEFANDMGSIAQSVASFASGLGSPLSMITSGLGLLSNLISIANKGAQERMKEMEEFISFYRDAIYRENELQSLIRKRERDEKLSPYDYYGAKNKLFKLEAQKKQVDKTIKELEDKIAKESYLAGKKPKKFTWNLFGLWGSGDFKDVWETLKGKNFDELTVLYNDNKLSEPVKKLYEQLKKAKDEGKELKEEYEEFMNRFSETFVGISFDSAMDAFKEMMADGRVEIEETGKYMESVFRKAIINSILDKLLKEKIESLVSEMQKSEADGTYNERRQEFMDKAKKIGEEANKLLEPYQELFKSMGENINGTAKGFASMSQATGDELNGRFTAMQMGITSMQMDTTNIRSTLSDILVEMRAGARTNPQSHIAYIIQVCQQLERIAKYTSVLPTELPSMNKTLQRIENKLR